MSGPSSSKIKIITEDSINPDLKRIEYVIRGQLDIRSLEIEEELAQGIKKPFTEVIKHIGDPQGLEAQKPITFFRQVICLLSYPELLEDSKFPQDAKDRVREILNCCMRGRTISSYTTAKGAKLFRDDIASYISKRDGYPADASNVFLTNGGAEGIRIVLKALQTEARDGTQRAGVMIPVPEYPLYSARLLELNSYRILYYLDEDNDWELNISELKRALDKARPHCVPRALVLINPGNPTGQVLSYQNIQDIIKFCHEERLVLFTDEVYQENVYREGAKFFSCRKVLFDMGPDYSEFQLISLHCSAKGYYGECSLRGGYFELVGFDEAVKGIFLKRMTLHSCPNIFGQVMMSLVCNPPQPGDESYELYLKEKTAILESFKHKAQMTTEILNSIEGIKCNRISGAMYAFPRLLLPRKAVEAAKAQGITPGTMYAVGLLETTGIYVVTGSGCGQKEGTYHFRITILPPIEKTVPMFERLRKYHEDFMNKYRDDEDLDKP